jgi:trimethylamine--corrinoid protein Co-methyltransferase
MARPGPLGGQYQPLTAEQIGQIHRASLDVLEHTGLQVENEEALALYRQGGARIEGQRVYITPETIQDALEQVPHKVLLPGRDPDQDVVLEIGRAHV